MSAFKNGRLFLGCCLIFAVAVLVAAPMLGMKLMTWGFMLGGEAGPVAEEIFWRVRVPRVLLAFLAGACLAVSGMAFQALFRNVLATPFTLGVSTGASLGATLYIRLGLAATAMGQLGLPVFAFGGAVLSIGLVYGLTRNRKGFSTATMLLAGVAVNFFFTSLIIFIQYISDFNSSFRIIRWLMGGLETVGFKGIWSLLPFAVTGMAVILYLTRELNLLTLGEDLAASRGVDIKGTKLGLFFATSFMVGGVVSVCGPIGFIGMMIPHICRLLVGPDHKYLAPGSILVGGAFLTLCDTVSRTIIAPAEIPVGVITALLGGPFFLWLLVGGATRKRGLL